VFICAASAHGQTVDPRFAEFNPSRDHSAVQNGVPIVSRYDLKFYLLGGSTPVRVVSLGKPAPGPDGVIRVEFLPLLNPPLTVGVTYAARVVAVGPSGSNASAPSNSFLFQPTLSGTCSYSVSPSSRSMPAGGGGSTFSVTSSTSCSWAATSQAGWITITSGASGKGNGTVGFSAAKNTGPARSGTAFVAGRSVTVTQAAGSTCTYSVSPQTPSVARTGGTVRISVTAGTGCSWTAAETPNVSWVSINSGTSATGNGTVTLQVTANSLTTSKKMTLTIAGRTVMLTQAGVMLTRPVGVRVLR
jgi:Putative binding domain, N-terminal/Viral BACON domain